MQKQAAPFKIEALVAIAVCGLDNGHLCIFQLDTLAAIDDLHQKYCQQLQQTITLEVLLATAMDHFQHKYYHQQQLQQTITLEVLLATAMDHLHHKYSQQLQQTITLEVLPVTAIEDTLEVLLATAIDDYNTSIASDCNELLHQKYCQRLQQTIYIINIASSDGRLD